MPRSSRLLCCLLFVATSLAAAPGSAYAAGTISDDITPAGTSVGYVEVPSIVTTDEARDVVAYSLVARSWAVKGKSDERVVGYLNHRGHEATITFVLKSGRIEIFCDGYAVSASGQRKKPEMPEGWINNLKKDVNKRLQLKAATK